MATRSDGSLIRYQKQHPDLEPKVGHGMVMSEEEAPDLLLELLHMFVCKRFFIQFMNFNF
jgi:hypothetical protein